MYKLIALDMDHTLLNYKREISEKNLKALKECEKNQVKIALASGRNPKGLNYYIEQVGDKNSWHIGINGMAIVDYKGNVEYPHTIERKKYNELIEGLRSIHVPFCVFAKEGNFYEYADGLIEMIRSYDTKEVQTSITKMDVSKVETPLKIVCRYLDDRTLKEIRSLVDDKNWYTCVADEHWLEFMPKGVTKYSALLKIAEKFNIKEGEIVAVGDLENDIPMIKGAKLGVAVANAAQNVKDVADLILPKTNDEDAISYLIENYILK